MRWPPVPDALLSRIEDAGLNTSAPPPQQRWIDGWLVRFSPATAKRSLCINALEQAVYRGLGFVDGYAYHYRTAQVAAQ